MEHRLWGIRPNNDNNGKGMGGDVMEKHFQYGISINGIRPNNYNHRGWNERRCNGKALSIWNIDYGE